MKTSGLFIGACLAGLIAYSFQISDPKSGPEPAGANVPGFTNVDFELGTPGQQPPGWFVPKMLADRGFSAVLTTNQPAHGKQCVEVRWPQDRKPTGNLFANLMQRIDPKPLRGKQIKVTAAIRVAADKPGGRAQMWLRVDRPSGMGAFDNMNNRPVVSADWTDYSITADVADDAVSLNLGLMTLAGATAWWDNVRCEVLTEFKTVTDPQRLLSDLGLSNLGAFTRLVGYVRHFHPSDQAATNDWLDFIVTTLPQIENAQDAATLASHLEATFQPIAPTVRVFPSGQEPALPPELTQTSGAAPSRVRVWEHIGYAQSSSGVGHVYSSQRLSLETRELATLPTYAQPTNVFRAQLGAGVACLVPTALFTDDRGTLPHPAQALQMPREETRFSVNHRGARLATVMLAWNILQHFYPYFDVMDTDWSKELEIALRKGATDVDEIAFYQTLNRLIVALQDGHGTLSGPGLAQEAPLPIRVELIEDQIVILAVASDTSQLHPGDVVARVDGVPAREAFDKLARQVSAATPQRRKQVAFRFGSGPYGTQAKLDVRGADNVLRTVKVARADQTLPLAEKRPPKLDEIKPGVFYVDITRLTDAEFNEALPRLAKAEGLVFDLRGYPPGSPHWLTHLSPKVLQSARWNVPKQHRPDRSDVEWLTSHWDLQPQSPQLSTNRVFLTDGSAISYA